MGLCRDNHAVSRRQCVNRNHTEGWHTVDKHIIVILFDLIHIGFQNTLTAHGIDKPYLKTRQLDIGRKQVNALAVVDNPARSIKGFIIHVGSLKSEVYFCIYEKDYEQYVKYDIPIEDTKIKNRFEIRLKNERAYYAVRDLLTYHDAERTAFDIINRYMRFADKEVDKRRSEWKTNEKWAYFIGSDRGRLKLTTKPEPYTLTRTLNWISRQVAPTWKVLQQIDSTNGTTYLKDILDHAKLTKRHRKLIEQQTTSTEEAITKQGG